MFKLLEVQHWEWFIAGLLPHIRIPLQQQRINSQEDVLEIAMKLESTPEEPNESSSGLAQVQTQLATTFTNQLQEMLKGKAVCEQVWCTTCRTEGHHRNECPILGNSTASTGAPNLFPLLEDRSGIIYVKLGAMRRLSVLCCINIRLPQRLRSVTSVNPWDMM